MFDDVAVIVIANPPVNASDVEVRRGLLRAVQAVSADSQMRAAVVIGDGTSFIAGSDLREFGKPLADPQLPEVVAAIEACPSPIVAALCSAGGRMP